MGLLLNDVCVKRMINSIVNPGPSIKVVEISKYKIISFNNEEAITNIAICRTFQSLKEVKLGNLIFKPTLLAHTPSIP